MKRLLLTVALLAAAPAYGITVVEYDRTPEYDTEKLFWIEGIGFRRMGPEQCWDKLMGPVECDTVLDTTSVAEAIPVPRPCSPLPGCLFREPDETFVAVFPRHIVDTVYPPQHVFFSPPYNPVIFPRPGTPYRPNKPGLPHPETPTLTPPGTVPPPPPIPLPAPVFLLLAGLLMLVRKGPKA